MSEPVTLDVATRAEVIERLIEGLNQHYIFPEVAAEVEADLRRRQRDGEYDGILEGNRFAEVLTVHLQEVSHDRHLRMFWSLAPRPVERRDGPTPEEIEEIRETIALQNFGVHKIERLAGNVGYLDLRGFMPAPLGSDTLVAAMQVLAHASALIVDVRKNGGGDPAMIALVSSYLFDEPTHLNSLYWRAGDRTQQFWTLPYVPGARFGGHKPLYVLTSSFTFSGAEEFAYNLKTRERATIVGEVTGGGAHPTDGFPLTPHFGVGIPVGRAINPISNTNWEGIGVAPDVAVPADEALPIAYRMALEAVLEAIGATTHGPKAELAQEARTALEELQGVASPDEQAT